MLIDCKGKYGKFLILGVQTNKGKARDKFIELAKKNYIPDFNDIFTSNYKNDFILTVN